MLTAYRTVDVFTQTPLEGNPLAVFPDARGIEPATMQRIARELNLSETTFVLPATRSDCAARVRIFTPANEMLFAGHPTIGTAWVLRDAGIVPVATSHFALEENIGPVSIRIDPEPEPIVWLATPPISSGATYDRAKCAAAISLSNADLLDGVPCRLLTAGNPNIYITLRDKAAVDRAVVDTAALRTMLGTTPPTCIFVFAPTADGAYSRMFAPELGVPEDPATGSATGPLAAFMMEHGLAAHTDGTRLISEQGTKMGRRSILHVQIRGDHGTQAIEVGGYVTPIATATMTL